MTITDNDAQLTSLKLHIGADIEKFQYPSRKTEIYIFHLTRFVQDNVL